MKRDFPLVACIYAFCIIGAKSFASPSRNRNVATTLRESPTNDGDDANLFAKWLSQTSDQPAGDSQWFSHDDTYLPFDCTGCGKCCKTKGDVLLSPDETRSSSSHLGLTVEKFKELYVAEEEVTVIMSLDPVEVPPGETGWTVLRHKKEDGSCVFLGKDNMCGIYEARPLQCSTYPFWPRIMASRENWNDEVRLKGDGPTVDESAPTDSSGMYWSVENGGCEGMSHAKTNEDVSDSDNEVGGVSPIEAAERLSTYERYKKRFPTTELRPIQR